MRRILTYTPLLVAVIAVVAAVLPTAAQDTPLFATNTPRPTSLQLVTNTPYLPTNTPTNTFTPSNTPTFTPTFTPTNTPTPTFTPTFTPSDTPTPTNTPTPTPTPNGPIYYPEGVNPLTGQMYTSEEAQNRRNLIVKVSNWPPIVRPQSGVNQADVVYEYEAEGGVTRFAAIFRENAPSQVGSVRSARLLDMELVEMYQALLAYSGTSEPIQNLILDSEWRIRAISPLMGDNCEEAGFCRFPQAGKAFEHTLFLDTSQAWNRATGRGINTGYPGRGFAFADQPDEGGLPALDVRIDWYGQTYARWQYDAATGRYYRWTEGVPHFDALDGEQIWADNIIVIEVPHNQRPDLFPEGSNYQSLEVALWEQGRALLFRDGQQFGGFWLRRNREPGTALQLQYGNNLPIMMKPGRTWVTVVRGLGQALVEEQPVDAVGTATAIFLTASPTPTWTPGPSPTPLPW